MCVLNEQLCFANRTMPPTSNGSWKDHNSNQICVVALHLIEVLSPWRLSTNEVLATQVDVFEESQAEDESHMTMPGGLDLNSHQDIFNALFTKVNTIHAPLGAHLPWGLTIHVTMH